MFIGPYEHHSNELPWRESIADVVVIPADAGGHIDLVELERELERHARRPLKIGSFSAASNVTGILSDTRALAVLLHRHGALAFFDFAAAGPYLEIDMNPKAGPTRRSRGRMRSSSRRTSSSGARARRGCSSPRGASSRTACPPCRAAGPWSTSAPTSTATCRDVAHREEGGTPAILESIRAGLVFQLKQAVGVPAIREREESFVRRAIASWRDNPRIEILGNLDAPRLSIVSFMIRGEDGRHLHHNFVVAVLSDLFGIQARGGCSCAGPYGHRLLGIDRERSRELDRVAVGGEYGIKPGWARLGFNYFISEADVRVRRPRGAPPGRPGLPPHGRLPLRSRHRPLATLGGARRALRSLGELENPAGPCATAGSRRACPAPPTRCSKASSRQRVSVLAAAAGRSRGRAERRPGALATRSRRSGGSRCPATRREPSARSS